MDGRNSPWAWLRPGMHVKRWLALLLAGIVLISLGLTFLLRQLYVELTLPPVFYYLTLQFLSRPARAILLGLLGMGVVLLALLQINRSLLNPFISASQVDVAERIYQHHRRRRGPKIVALGGGTGLSTLLRGLKHYSDNITAIVSVADDGGSSGKLRQATGMLPPGDIRQCLVALSEEEGVTGQLFQYRFSDQYGLGGHSFGNLFIAAMSDIAGSFEQGVVESSRVLAVRGRVIPSTLKQVTLAADLRVENAQSGYGWQRVVGEFGHSRGAASDRAGLSGARDRAGLSRGGEGALAGRFDHRRPGQPVHQRAAQPAGARDRSRHPLLPGAQALHLQCGDAAGRDHPIRCGCPCARPAPACGRSLHHGAGQRSYPAQPGRDGLSGAGGPARTAA
ncbi:MAG: gluconeogenesis factor YvcK family protein [Anaerolineae bacterium]